MRAKLAKPLNDALRPLRVQLVSGTSPDPAIQDFISARKTLAAAQQAGLSVGAYIDQTFAEPGATPNTVKAMLELAGLRDSCERVVEIGPGSGRYAEEIIAALHPDAYEIYETAQDWMPHLRKLPNVVVRDCDGHTMAQTKSGSVDLVHAQKVFVYLQFYATAGYLEEMARVVRPGGAIAFDVVTEACLDDKVIEWWTRHGSIYHPLSRVWLVDFLERRGLTLAGSYFAPLPPGTTELLVFRRD
jgi:hypothetical protein